jgi:hypothetical protein
MKRLIIVAAASVALSACGQARPWLEIPAAPETGSIIIAAESSDGLHVFALEGDSALELQFDQSETVFLTGFLYPTSLTEVGIMPGELFASETGGSIPRGATRKLSATLSEGALSAWTPANAISPAVTSFRRDGLPRAPDACSSFEIISTFELETQRAVSIAIPLHEGSALLVTDADGSDEHAYRVRRDDIERLPQEIVNDSFPRQAMFDVDRDEHGSLWVATTSYVWTGSFEDGFEQLPANPARQEIVIDVLAEPEGPERIYTLAVGGQLEAFTSTTGTWETLARLPDAESLLWLGPNDLLGADAETGRIFRYSGGTETEDGIEFGPGLKFEDWVNTSLGPVAVASNVLEAEFHRRKSDGEWERLGERVPTQQVQVLAPFQDGFLFSGVSGYLAQYSDGQFCPSSDGLAASLQVQQITPLGGGAFVLSGRTKAALEDSGSATAVYVVEASSN